MGSPSFGRAVGQRELGFKPMPASGRSAIAENFRVLGAQRTDGWMHGWMERQVDRWADGWMCGWTGEWVGLLEVWRGPWSPSLYRLAGE